MDWLNTAIWNLCISMLPHRNTRALLVPVLCVALLVPFAAATAASTANTYHQQPRGIDTATIESTPALGPIASIATATDVNVGYTPASVAQSIVQLSKEVSSRDEPAPTVSYLFPAILASTEHIHAHGTELLQCAGIYGSGGSEASFCLAQNGFKGTGKDKSIFTIAQSTVSSFTTSDTADLKYNPGFSSNTNSKSHKRSKKPQRSKPNSQLQSKGVVLLGKDSNGIVPRKFTIAEPSVVADAEGKHLVMLPAKPYAAAAASESMLLKRSMLERSGVSLVDTMVVITVDGRIYGVSRFDGSIVWSRDSLLDSTSEYGPKSAHPQGMVWTRNRVESSFASASSSGIMGEQVNDDAGVQDSTEAEFDVDGDEDDGEEEWLLEQGIDWRSDPQVLELQRQRRRQWLAKKKKTQHRGSGKLRDSATTTGSHGSFSDHVPDEPPEVLYIAEPGGNGSLYMYSTELGLKKLPLTIKDLVDQSPVQDRGILYTGNKEASFAAIDLNTGQLLNAYGDERERGSDRYQTSQRFSGKRKPIRLLLGEMLNRVRIFPAANTDSSSAGAHKSEVSKWELYHRSIHAPSLDPEVDAILAELSDAIEALGVDDLHKENTEEYDDEVTSSSARGPTKFVMTEDGGFVMIEATTGIPLWAQEFDSPVVSVFDVFGIAIPDAEHDNGSGKSNTAHINYVARQRNLSPISQQARYLRWRQLYELDHEARSHEHFDFGKTHSQEGRWRTGSSGGNVLAGAFWERTSKTTSTLPQIAYIGKLKDTLYTITSNEFPLIDRASLTSSLLLALVQAKRDQQRYPELQHPEWWDRWNFLTQDAIVLRVLQEARVWWLDETASESRLVPENSFERLLDMVAQHQESKINSARDIGDRQMCDAGGDRCYYRDLVGIHPVEPLVVPGVPALEGAPFYRPGLPDEDMAYDEHGNGDGDVAIEDYRRGTAGLPWDDELPRQSNEYEQTQAKDDNEEWPWWRYVGHYMTRVAAFIGYVVTIAALVVFVGVIYLLRPRNKRRPRMWIDATGDDTDAPGRRARLRLSWALMHRMWATLKEEWRLAIEEAWRNPNAAAVLRRTGVSNRVATRMDDGSGKSGSGDEDDASSDSAHNSGSMGGSAISRNGSSTSLLRQGSMLLSSGAFGNESSHSSRNIPSARRGSTSASPASLGVFGREDSEPSSIDRFSSGRSTPRRNSTGTLPMTPLKRGSAEGESIERLQMASPRVGQSSQLMRLGAITLTDQVLGYGSHGTVVYRGEFQGRAVAVKRLLLDFYDVADHEVQVLQESDSHPNVIRYFCTERHDHFMYIALELCCGSLADAIMRTPKAKLANQLLSAIPKKNVLYQLARGLHHLHALKLVHRDIKPQNILIAPPPHRRRRRTTRTDSTEDAELAFEDFNIVASGTPRVLISDFGLSRILDDDESSFANTFTMHGIPAFGGGVDGPNELMPGGLPAGMIGGIGGGTVGWRAPECFDSPEARAVIGAAPSASTWTEANSESPSWPSLRGAAPVAVDEPSPYVSRGTKSRLRHLAMSQANPITNANSSISQGQTQQQQSEGDEPDSLGASLTSTTDRAGSSIPFESNHGSRRRMTRAVDIFSMGCVFYYVLMNGDHPFGDRLSREQRILAGTPELRMLESSNIPSAIEAVDIIAHMVARYERDRPSAASVLVHPYFWDATQRLSFLQDVSDCLEAEARLIKAAREDIPEPPKKTKSVKKKGGQALSASVSTGGNSGVSVSSNGDKTGDVSSHAISKESIEDIIAKLPTEQAAAVRRAITLLDVFEENSSFVMAGPPPSADGFQVVGIPPSHHAVAVNSMSEAVGSISSSEKTLKPRRVAWDRRLDPHLRRDLGKFRKYDGMRLRDLLRIIRNKKNHYQDMPQPLRETLGDIPDGYLHYFESRFPYLLLHCYYFVLEDDSLRTATVFRPYFRPPAM
ncbi:bifunctional endoribonuclease/protein kinase ire1 [Coemansia spiralis]|uniref:non-specific serine/threonine protein kinase n=2 Tax=Coemansia TaxID=4863 RepID=A0A9W8GAI3_9FUNG|nr:bifunctional endoribonuclease/protein kinase ire1 [Coemansia umbellata]KAJ2624754.1 bifunctional endoribonuclease/protein kinase ire1 [Coemansia sp. RSA 1358]KAJ2678296.1 bifunctional endoribonuclease/protein kinase ire1 [Coemansia spiralis]